MTDLAADLPQFVPDPLTGDESFLIRRGRDVMMRSAICTHAGCIVEWDPKRQELRCPCHGTTYDAWSGAVLSGPARGPLPPIKTKVRDGVVYRT